jgi:hypothetical protein
MPASFVDVLNVIFRVVASWTIGFCALNYKPVIIFD